MMSFFMDLYRIPDKVKAVMDYMLPMYIGMALQAVQASGIRGVWIGGWRTASAMLAPKLWDKFVFPYMHQVVTALAQQNIISILHLDQDWTRDIARFKELPAKSCVLNLDGMTDVRRVKQALGDQMSILGDVPSELLATGTPERVRTYVKELIEDVGPTGLLLCPGCDAPINAKHENVVAMYDAGREFGATA
jgi:uroporphyrinogen-III decarboxylase